MKSIAQQKSEQHIDL